MKELGRWVRGFLLFLRVFLMSAVGISWAVILVCACYLLALYVLLHLKGVRL